MKKSLLSSLFPARVFRSDLVSESAKYDQLDDYTWYVYRGRNKVNITIRTHKRIISTNDIYGFRQTRNGTYYVILPEMYHVDFVVDKATANRLVNNSDPIKRPKIQNLTDSNTGKIIRNAAIDIAASNSPNRQWDSPRYKAQRVINESSGNIDYANYQWRKITSAEGFRLKKGDRQAHYKRNDIVGMRFIKPATGGIVIDQEFNRFVLTTEDYDQMVHASVVLPKTRWPEGGFGKEDAEAAQQEKLLAEKQKRAAERRRIREAEEARKREEAQAERERKAEQRRLRKQQELEAQENAISLQEHMDRVRRSRTVPLDDRELREKIKKIKKLKAEDLGLRTDHIADDDDDFNLDLNNLSIKKDEEIEDKKQKPAPLVDLLNQAIKETKQDLPIFNMSDLDSDDDVEESVIDDGTDIDFEDTEADYDIYAEEDPQDVEPEPVDEEDPIDQDDDADEDVEIAEDELESEEDYDDEEFEDEEPKPSKPEVKFEEGDAIIFAQDSTEKREFMIFNIETLKGNDHILIYKLYDVTNEPDDYRSVRIDTHKKRRLEDMARLSRKIPPKEFIKYQAMAEDMMKNPEPIES